jgi:hypothetical protein
MLKRIERKIFGELFILKLGHKKLITWVKSLELIEEIYHISEKLPLDEKYILVSQLKRAAI